MAHELDDSGQRDAVESSKKNLTRRGYLKVGTAIATIAAGSGTGVSALTDTDGSVDAFSTGFGDYTS
jgi:hypothetical protein